VRDGPISLGDVVRVNIALRPGDAETAETIREMLGVEHAPVAPAQPAVGEWGPSLPGPAPPVRPVRLPPKSAAGPGQGAARGRTILSLERSAAGDTPASSQRPVWLDAPGDTLAPATHAQAPLPLPLFGPPRGRSILSAALATTVEEGDVDIDRVTRTIAERRTLRALPRRPVPTLRRGVQLLLDVGAGMDPYRADQQTLRNGLDDILSDDRFEVLSFAGCPSRGAGTGAREDWKTWNPPPAGTPILAVTDLGIGGSPFNEDRAGPAEWLRFAQYVRAEGRVLMALVPYEARRWPAGLARAMTLLHWSERTTVGEIRRTLRRAYSRLR
jgi:hypothetical protein